MIQLNNHFLQDLCTLLIGRDHINEHKSNMVPNGKQYPVSTIRTDVYVKE